jgi:hypothetical protein
MPMSSHDLLPSWNDEAAEQTIRDFVARVTTDGGPDLAPEPERIAVFDDDGTLWCEKPMLMERDFLLERLAAMAEQDASFRCCSGAHREAGQGARRGEGNEMDGGGHERALEGHVSASDMTLPGLPVVDMARSWRQPTAAGMSEGGTDLQVHTIRGMDARDTRAARLRARHRGVSLEAGRAVRRAGPASARSAS